ncbi:N-methyl-L-tryptophan oxidase [soil metagenome]
MNPNHFDVIVVGAGVAGSAAAYQLAATQKVLVLEQFPFLHKLGSSHGGSRIFRHAYGDARYVALAVAADELWQRLEHDTDEKLLTRTGGLDIGREGYPALTEVERALKKAGRPVETLSPSDVEKRFPAFRLPAGNVALYQPDAGILAATRCVNALLRGAAAGGAVLHDDEPVTTFNVSPDRVDVVTARGSYSADKLIITAGPWLSEGLSEGLGELTTGLAPALHVEQQQVIYLKVAQAEKFAPSRMPIFINHDPQAEVYGFPLFDLPHAIKISDHANAPTVTLRERKTELMEARALETVRRAQSFLPGVTNDIVHFEMCLYTKTPDEHFILDLHPEHDNVVIGGGFSGHGFKFGPVLGEILADLALAGSSRHDLSLFASSRFAAQAAG